MVINIKRGRPFIYQDDTTRKEKRKEQNRINQQKCRLRKKLHKDILHPKNTLSFNETYRKGIIEFHNQFDYDYFFTGTINPNHYEKEQLKQQNKEVDILNNEYNLTTGQVHEKRIGLQSLRSYTERYLQFLSEKNLFERCFVVFEKGKYNKLHTHILFKSNPDKINFELTTENSWLLGTQTITIHIPEQDKIKTLEYMTKEMKPMSSSVSDQKLIDSWFIRGDYDLKKKNIDTYIPVLNFTFSL